MLTPLDLVPTFGKGKREAATNKEVDSYATPVASFSSSAAILAEYKECRLIRSGFVGFFDILGYSAIAESDNIETTAKLIDEILLDLPSSVHAATKNSINADIREYFIAELNKIEIRIISDSILMVVPMEDNPRIMFSNFTAHVFLLYASRLMRHAFDAGLPLRGAIDFGRYYLSGHCFAGKPIINAYRASMGLQAAGCVLSDYSQTNFLKYYHGALSEMVYRMYVFTHRMRDKGGNDIAYSLVDWFRPFKDWAPEVTDIEEYVRTAFRAHGKIISSDVEMKVEGTRSMIESSLNREARFGDLLKTHSSM